MVEMLEDITVLDLASVGPAARASRWLADYGATVVKVGPVPKDTGVQITPPFYAYSAHRRMQRALFDMKAQEGREAFLRLVEQADVLIESFRPGVVDRLGIGWEVTSARNPRLVYCSTSGFGQTGPRSQWAGHDLNYLAVGGFLHCNGRAADGQPPVPGLTLADSAGGGMHAVMAILAALVRRATTNEGAFLDVSIADGVLGLMALAVDEYLATGEEPAPRHGLLTGRYACYDTYPTRDGRWLTVAAIEPRFWTNLCELVGLPQWATHQEDDVMQDQIRAELRAVFLTRDLDDWIAQLSPADTCVAPVLTIPEIVTDEQFRARDDYSDAHDAIAGDFQQVGPVFAGMARTSERYEARDMTTTDTDALLRAAGLRDDELANLHESGAIA
jgi:alpha-methylacyl-CoA racemase